MEELFAEKGRRGFDSFEIEFLETRFKGARQIIQMLNEKDSGALETKVVDHEEKADENRDQADVVNLPEAGLQASVLSEDPKESLTEEPLKPELKTPEDEPDAVEAEIELPAEPVGTEPEISEEKHEEKEEEPEPVASGELELGEVEERLENRRVGDSFLKEKSLNDLLGNGSTKLENKLLNSPVSSIQHAIGINDRYQYIRELFDGSADAFAKTVETLDAMHTIQEAATYLQQNHKWKKTETSMKFVNLVKRRFLNE